MNKQALEKLLLDCKTAVEIIADSYDYDPKEEYMDCDCQAVNVLKQGIKEAEEVLKKSSMRDIISRVVTEAELIEMIKIVARRAKQGDLYSICLLFEYFDRNE